MTQPQQLQQQSMMSDRPMDHDEKKMRRQIANSNERRRMQSINAGFQSLRQLLPHHEGEKLSKVSRPRSDLLPLYGE
jgi:Helix-loop-helix DNA-binding domain